ncbi:hypothetical protein JWG40_03875 [Leptospira sp. 201903074]|uniref:LIC10173 family protein n=1 Tax=Leptospira abararensis TaxID=2810036 RepID=UPI001962A8B4|nr:hypothetical protein [Leptospira abararensis]MBM9546139.1 hypothetical protein [Leptospira abararensis]
MKAHHIAYIKSMIASCVAVPEDLDTELDQTPSPIIPADKVFEYVPKLDDLQDSIPCAVIKYNGSTNRKWKNRKHRLSTIVRPEGKFFKNAVRNVEQEIKYTVDFWFGDPSLDVVSSISDRGMLDQCLLYVATHRNAKTTEEIPFEIRSGITNMIDDPEAQNGYYKLIFEIIFKDGLYTIEEEETLAGVTLEIQEPVQIERK